MPRLLFTLACFLVTAPLFAAEAPLVESFLTQGKLAEGDRALTARLKERPKDDQARFGLGVLQFLQGIERLGQSLHKHGALGAKTRLGSQLPLVRLAVPENPNPQEISYADARKLTQNLIDDLAKAETTLAEVTDPEVKLPLHFGLIALDLDGDGKAGGDETLWKLYTKLNNGLRLTPDATPTEVQNFVITFDRGDVAWLRGYCHLLSAICEVTLAHDTEMFFNVIAPYLYAKPATPPLPRELLRSDQPFVNEIADAIAGLHLARFKVDEPARMKAAHAHLCDVITLSRESWKAIQAETDDEGEWVPNAKQTSVIPNARVTAEMITGWHEFLDEAEAILAGKKLVPHWRMSRDYGVNLRKVFHEPRDFDLILWAHGAAALPFAEKGDRTSPETWMRLQTMFRGQFVGFALWFN